MASLRRSAKSPYWLACITLPCGTRTNRSTKTSNRRIAQRIADELQSASNKAAEGRLVETQARNVLNDILASVGQKPLSSETVEPFLRCWLSGKCNGGTSKRYSSTITAFLLHLATKRHAMLTTIGHEDILRFIESREKTGVATKTISVDLRALSAAFNVARKLGLTPHNPVERALAIRPIAVQSSRRECFTSEQIVALLNAAEGDWKTAILLGYYTGARLGDCAGMRWDNINSALGVIDFEPQKTRRKKRLVVPIHPELLTHLRTAVAPDRDQTYLCPALADKQTGGKQGLSNEFKRVMKLAGVDSQTGRGTGIRRFAKLSFHSLRHSFNSALANQGVDQETRMALAGHTNVMVNDDYTHMDLPKLRTAVERLPGLG